LLHATEWCHRARRRGCLSTLLPAREARRAPRQEKRLLWMSDAGRVGRVGQQTAMKDDNNYKALNAFLSCTCTPWHTIMRTPTAVSPIHCCDGGKEQPLLRERLLQLTTMNSGLAPAMTRLETHRDTPVSIVRLLRMVVQCLSAGGLLHFAILAHDTVPTFARRRCGNRLAGSPLRRRLRCDAERVKG
jgi:hypothetical protein